MKIINRGYGWLSRKGSMVLSLLTISIIMVAMLVEGSGLLRFFGGSFPNLSGVAFATGELPEVPAFTGGAVLIGTAGTAILLLAVGIVIFRRLKSVVR